MLAFVIINYQADRSKIKELGVAAFIFYDTETSGLDKNFGQIFQFAAVLTDNELNVIDKFEIRSRRMPQIVPEPSALLVTGINPETLDQAEYSYYEFATKIRDKILEWSPAIVCGYNTFSFDEHFMRSMFYQNLYPPYLTQINGNSRLDILPLVRAAEHLYPGKINYPINAKGKTSKKLEDVAPANGFTGHDAHDAMGDVMATVFVAKLVKKIAPALWGRAKASSSRGAFNSLIKDDEPLIIFDFNNGWPVIFPALKVGKVDDGKNTLFFDLRYDPKLVNFNDAETCLSGRSRPFRRSKDSEVPLTLSIEEYNELGLGLDVDFDQTIANCQILPSHFVFEDAVDLYNANRKEFQKSPHAEEQLYEDFHAFDDEKWLLEDFHSADADLKMSIAERFSDKRFRKFAQRIVYENFKDLIPPERLSQYDSRIKERIGSDINVPWATVPKARAVCYELLKNEPEKEKEIRSILGYLDLL
ncbi:exonuclease domain-containing protein [Alphaproteobacteria bacterium]|nr:exonuclease domain-containing protein [Alphaproteobacteria bacterium]